MHFLITKNRVINICFEQTFFLNMLITRILMAFRGRLPIFLREMGFGRPSGMHSRSKSALTWKVHVEVFFCSHAMDRESQTQLDGGTIQFKKT